MKKLISAVTIAAVFTASLVFAEVDLDLPGSSSVVQGVAESINGNGYSGIGYRTSGVRAIAVGNPPTVPSAETAADGFYSLARFLYVAVNKHPNRNLNPLEREFLRLALSRQGQEVVVRDGYIRCRLQ